MLRDLIFLILFFFFAAVWLVGWAAFHIAGGVIQLLLLFAVISLIIHLVRRRPAV